MLVTTKFEIDLAPDDSHQHADQNESMSRIEVVQGDTDTHAVELSLYAGGEVWNVPEDVTALVSYCKSDGTGGSYDTLSDSTEACSIGGNVVTAVLAAQMLTVPGPVLMTIALVSRGQKLHIFEAMVNVHRNPAEGVVESEDYVNMQQWLESLVPAVVHETGTSEEAVMSQKAVTEAIAGAVQQGPEFVNSIDECTDTAKLYVLPDGYIYAYLKSAGAVFTNLADPLSSDWANDSRLNSSALVVANAGSVVTNWIDAVADDVIRVRGIDLLDATAGYIAKYTAAGRNESQKCNSFKSDFVQDENGVTSYTIWYNNGEQTSTAGNIIKVRLSGALTGSVEDIIITKNEQIAYGDTGAYAWQNTGRAYQPADYEDRIIALEENTQKHDDNIKSMTARVDAMETGDSAAQLPDYWQEYLPEKIAAIEALQMAGGKDCFSFPLLTDIHISSNLGKQSGLLAKTLMDACHMRYALCLGDVVTRGSDKSAASMDASFAAAEALLRPIRDKLLQTQGNHDGSWGAEDLDGDGDIEGTEYYCYGFTPQKIHNLIYRKVGLVGTACFDASGCGYYIDDVPNRVRYIILNSHHNTYAENGDGTVKYSNMRIFRFGQSQYDLMVEALSTVPGDDWMVLSASHVPLHDEYASAFGGAEGDHVLMRNLLAAYQNKTAFSGSFPGTYGDDAVSVAADFSNAKGMYVAHFAGHTHTDENIICDGIQIITTRCDAKEENDDVLKAEKAVGTVTEQSFDIFTVNRATRTIYATKIGAGEDRIIHY